MRYSLLGSVFGAALGLLAVVLVLFVVARLRVVAAGFAAVLAVVALAVVAFAVVDLEAAVLARRVVLGLAGAAAFFSAAFLAAKVATNSTKVSTLEESASI